MFLPISAFAQNTDVTLADETAIHGPFGKFSAGSRVKIVRHIGDGWTEGMRHDVIFTVTSSASILV